MTTQSIVTRIVPDRAVVYLYWATTTLVVAELVVGGWWDVARVPRARDIVVNLGYPTYFLVILGVWKLLGALALVVPRFPLVKEWAYAGTFFVYTGAIASHLTTGYARYEVPILTVMALLTAASWALRPDDRQTLRSPSGPDTSRNHVGAR
ncbi:DoxX family protein [Nocardia sp. CDC153]|uniref:DoxX family protein n=1 Tax=Nocardia sp. CDC153 TaxID=3112167 RepID=UPI002DBBFDDF|nr:DoxX family protein [Nocardia sp. CDC153]MEC3953302.1 DoxX family protein [Nocardia sp. CDC153]